MAEQIEFQLVVDGGDEAQAQFEALKIKEMEAAEAASELASQLRRLQSAESRNAEAINEVRTALVRAQQAQRGFASQAANASRALSQSSASAAASGRSFAELKQQMQNSGRQMGGMVNVVAELGYSLGAAIPGMQQYGTQLAMVGGSAYQLGAALGPVGVVIGVVSGLLPTAISLFNDLAGEEQLTASESRRLAREQQQLAESVESANDELRGQIELLRGIRSERNMRQRLEAGLGDPDEQEAFTTEAEKAAREARVAMEHEELRFQRVMRSQAGVTVAQRREHEATMLRLRTDRLAAEREAQQRHNTQIVARVEQAEDMAEELARAARADAERAAREAERAARRHRQRRQRTQTIEQLMSRAAGGGSMESLLGRIEAEGERRDHQERMERVNEQIEADRKLREEQRITAREEREAHRASERAAREQLRKKEQLRREQARASEQLKQEAQTLIGPAIQGLTDALSATIAGTKTADEAFKGLLSSFLEMIAQYTALQAAKEFAEAIASFASYRYDQGAQHLAAGAAFTAVAVAAGAGAIATAPSQSAPAEPTDGAASAAGGGSATYIYNVSGPVITAGSRANAGREIAGVVRDGERRFGRTG